MVWTIALWFLFAVAAPISVSTNEEGNMDNWPYIFKKHDKSEQSPVDISTKNAQRRYLPFLHSYGYWAFDKATVIINNTGHTVCVKLTNNSEHVPYISGGPLDSRYEFNQMHFHWGEQELGSEHKINGHQYAMEVHIVHFKKEYGSFENALSYPDGLCVIGFFGTATAKDNPEMVNFITDLRHIINPNTYIIRNFKEDFIWLKKKFLKQQYFTYHGSLTTKPFSECVVWIVFPRPFAISKKQLCEFRKLHSSHHGMLINENDRDLQPFNDRPIIYGN